MKKVVLGGVGGLVALAGLFTLAGRGLGELGGYFRAGAEGTVANPNRPTARRRRQT